MSKHILNYIHDSLCTHYQCIFLVEKNTVFPSNVSAITSAQMLSPLVTSFYAEANSQNQKGLFPELWCNHDQNIDDESSCVNIAPLVFKHDTEIQSLEIQLSQQDHTIPGVGSSSMMSKNVSSSVNFPFSKKNKTMEENRNYVAVSPSWFRLFQTCERALNGHLNVLDNM